MENSIEEDIKILEEFKTNGYNILLMKYGDRIKTNFKLAKAIEHILSDYKRILKENEKLKALDSSNSKMIANMSKRHFQDREKIRNSIPVQKVKDKIEKVKEFSENAISSVGLQLTIEVLQELLEKE